MPKRSGSDTVLVVDDYVDGRELYAEYLEFSGFRVLQAKDGAEAVKLAQEGHPDIIIMDLSLPVVDGYQATRQLKSDDRTRDIPVVALTGHVMEQMIADARSAGCVDFIGKPCFPEDLERKIRGLLSTRSADRLVKVPGEDPEPTE